MARVKQRIYPGSKERTIESMLEVCQNTLQELGMEITTQFLDKSLIECIGKPPAGSPLGKQNIITVYKEEDKIYIKFKYEMPEPEKFWELFEVNLQIHGASTEEIEKKAKIITKICKTIREMGSMIDEEDAWDFLYHYEKNMKALPTDEEFNLIAMDYIKMLDELGITDQFMQQEYDQEEEVEEKNTGLENEGVVTTATEALIDIINEIPTLDVETKEFYISLFGQIAYPDQERLVQKIRVIESDLNKIPYLLDSERIEIRNAVMEMSTEKRRKKLMALIKERKKNEALYMNKFMTSQIKLNLQKLPYLNFEDVSDILNIILTMPFDEKKQIVKTVNEIEQGIQGLIQQGIALKEIEIKTLRMDLIRLSPKDRLAKLDEVNENYRKRRVEKLIISEIPQLQFEDNSKLIKELMWLDRGEIKNRLDKIKNEISKKSQEKSDIFEKSSAGSACKKCGWPMGKFSKKCPRCGYNPDDDWFKL
jgi:hypothetical protein